MSKKTLRNYVCPKCGKTYQITTYDSINADIDEDMLDRVKSADIFQMECPHCHETYIVSYPCLYHNAQKRFMIWLTTDVPAQDPIYKQLVDKGYILRRCKDLESFLEKITLLEEGIDDRAVEYAKYDTFVDYIQNRGKAEDVTGVYFKELDGDILRMNLRLDDRGMTIQIPYDGLLAEMEDHTDLFAVDDVAFPVVDAAWIIQIFEAAEKSMN